MTYTILRSRRKTISICVHRDGHIEVRAPIRTSAKAIDAFVESKAHWIAEKQKEYKAAQSSLAIQKGKLPYLGKWLEIRTTDGCPYLGKDIWYLPDAECAAAASDKLLTDLARDYIVPRTKELAAQHGFSYTAIRITSARTRFGSCSGRNSLNFTKYLVMYPPDCIDHVILHELCHTRHHDHSQAFYTALGKVCPDHRAIREQMRRMPFLGDLLDKR